MSLSTLADEYVRSRYAPKPDNVGDGDVGTMRRTGFTRSIAGADRRDGDAAASLDRLMDYIPSEVIAAYIPLVSLATASTTTDHRAMWLLFVAFLLVTPVGVILIAYGKYRQLPEEQRKAKFVVPLFAAFAAFLAFAAWGAVMPSTVFTTIQGFQVWMGTAGVIIVTFMLTLLGPIFVPKQ